MPRNAEVIRQWQMLRAIERAHLGLTIDKLAAEAHVSTRTIRRDLAALAEAGFPLYDERIDGRVRWKLEGSPFRRLDVVGFTLSEACALYAGRALLDTMIGGPLGDDLTRAFEKFEHALAPMRHFLDDLPRLLAAKPLERTRHSPERREHVAKIVEAIFHRRQARMRYYSMSSRRDRSYRVDPLRLVYAEGGVYLLARVEAYQAVRTFAVERIRALALLPSTFAPPADDPAARLAHSLGVHEGEPIAVKVHLDERVAGFVTEREWHPSQRHLPQPDGSVIVELAVSNDRALHKWILGFGSMARVLAPEHLADAIAAELRRAAAAYPPGVTPAPEARPGPREPRRPAGRTPRVHSRRVRVRPKSPS
jgi:predicted DNA-binding transcriptional regulator YafY